MLSMLATVCCGQVFHDELGGRREAISDAISRCSRLLQETTSSEADDIRARYLSLPLSLSVCVSVSSWHTLLEHSRVHNRAPVFSRGCLLPRVPMFSGNRSHSLAASHVWLGRRNFSILCMFVLYVTVLLPVGVIQDDDDNDDDDWLSPTICFEYG